MADGGALLSDHQRPSQGRRRGLEIGLVNNMPDAALAATERQFAGLIQAGAGGVKVNLRLFSLPGVPRSEAARAAMAGRYQGLDALMSTTPDGLIVTGAEPRAADMRAEPYWDETAQLVDWAGANTLSTYWSCLAAHAAVLRLDGIERGPLTQKCSGVFACDRTGDDPLTAGLPARFLTPHSRRNTLAASDLIDHGYELLSISDRVGPDLFVRRGQSLFLFAQGHPEYDADSLLLEYCRDAARFLRGEQPAMPGLPQGYFDPATEAALLALAAEAEHTRARALLTRLGQIARAFTPPHVWRPHAEVLMGAWIRQIAQMKGASMRPVRQAAVS